MGCIASSSSKKVRYIDADGNDVEFWVEAGKLRGTWDGIELRLTECVAHVQLGERPIDGYLFSASGRLGPMAIGQFSKLETLAAQTGLRVEPARKVDKLDATMLKFGDQLVFVPNSERWLAGGYHHFCREGTVVNFPRQDSSLAEGCHVLFPGATVKHWTLWQDLKFYTHHSSSRIKDVDSQNTKSVFVDEQGKPIVLCEADFPASLEQFKVVVSRKLGHLHPLAKDACQFVDVDVKACNDMPGVYVASGKGNITVKMDRQLLETMLAAPRVVMMSGADATFHLGQDAFLLVGDLRLALVRPLGHTPLAVPGFQLIDVHAKVLEDDDLICQASTLGPITLVLNMEMIADCESPPKLAVAIACKAGEREDFGTFYRGTFNERTQQARLQYNYCRRDHVDGNAQSGGFLASERYDFHIYSLEEKRFVEHGRVGPE